MADFCLRGKAIARFRFLLEHDYPFEEAAQLAQDTASYRQELHDMVLTDLWARGDYLRLGAVKDESSLYSQQYCYIFEKAIDDGLGFRESSDYAERLANTVTAVTAQGNISRSVSSDAPNYGDEIYMAITTVDYPETTLGLTACAKIKEDLKEVIAGMSNHKKPHILECSYLDRLKFMRVVCGDEKSVKWMRGTLKKLKGSVNNKAYCLVPEEKLRRFCYYSVTIYDENHDTVQDILGRIQSQNSGFDTTKWKVLSKEISDDEKTKDKITKLSLSIPSEPDFQLLKSTENILQYKKSLIRFQHRPLADAIKPSDKQLFGRELRCLAFMGTFPAGPDETKASLLKSIEVQNQELDIFEWLITDAQHMVQDGQPMIKLKFIVHESSYVQIKYARRKVKFGDGVIKLQFIGEEESLKLNVAVSSKVCNPVMDSLATSESEMSLDESTSSGGSSDRQIEIDILDLDNVEKYEKLIREEKIKSAFKRRLSDFCEKPEIEDDISNNHKKFRRENTDSGDGSSQSGQKPVEIEKDLGTLMRRQKQIDYGKNTLGYEHYIQAVPRDQRNKNHPRTPPKHLKYSRRAWDGLVKEWRKKLHCYDD